MPEAIDTIWNDDLLNRKADADFLKTFLIGRMQERQRAGIEGSYVLNLEAEWGFGKTFFMKRLAQDLDADGYPVVFIDAWKNDFSDDPYTNVIAEVERYFQQFLKTKSDSSGKLAQAYDALKKNAGKIFWLGLKGGLKRGSRWLIAEGADEIVEVVDKHVVETGDVGKAVGDEVEAHSIKVTDGIIDAFADKRIKDFEEAKISLDRFRESLGDMLSVLEVQSLKKLPFFILIDELDRCRPTYAIAMLERIKHLFDVDNVVFILSTDTTQLAHSINNVYGQNFSSRRYLQRFFSRSFLLPKPAPKALVDALLDASGVDEDKWQAPGLLNDRRAFITKASVCYGMSPRDIQQAVDILLSITTVWPFPFPIQLLIMYPLIFVSIRGDPIDDLRDALYARSELLLRAWKTTDEGYLGHREFYYEADMSVFMKKMLEASNGDIRDLLDQGRPDYRGSSHVDYSAIWLYSVLEVEYAKRFNNIVKTGERSVIQSYPDWIKFAGRLSVI